MSNKGLLIVICGPSGVGKTSLCQRLVEQGIAFPVVTCTTRAPRPGEIDGTHYNFFTREEFENKVKSGEFVEHATVYGDYKGILRHDIEEAREQSKDVLLNIDVQGARSIREIFPEVLDIFVDVSSQKMLRKRLESRGEDSPEVVTKRLQEVEKERAHQKDFSRIVFNDEDEFESCYQKIKDLIENYRKEQYVR